MIWWLLLLFAVGVLFVIAFKRSEAYLNDDREI